MIEAIISLDNDIEELYNVFKAEQKGVETQRATYTVTKKSGRLIFNIKAKDLSRLKSYFNAITTSVEIYNKAKELAKENIVLKNGRHDKRKQGKDRATATSRAKP
ncbi:MAG: hypothetical protein V1859_00565 [archaeon]